MRVRRSRTSLAQGKADPIDRIAESGERRAIGGFRPRIVALLCLLGLLLPMLSVPQPVAVQTWAPAAGFDSGARLAVDSDVAKQPALLAKLGILDSDVRRGPAGGKTLLLLRSEEHTSELQSLMRSSYAVFC